MRSIETQIDEGHEQLKSINGHVKKRKTDRELGSALIASIAQAKKLSKIVRSAAKKNDVEAFSDNAYRLTNNLTEILHRIREEYSNMLLQTKMPRFIDDRQMMEIFLIKKSNVNKTQTLDFAKRCRNYVKVLEREAKYIFPPELWIKKIFRLHWKKVAFILGMWFLFVAGVAFWETVLKNKILPPDVPVISLPVPALPPVAAALSPNQGLLGDYYEGRNFDKLVKRTNDKQVNFLWAEGAPFQGFPPDDFSARWTGYLNVEKPGDYEFTGCSDDGMALWIDGNKVIDKWYSHRLQFDKATVHLTEGFHRIKLEYFEKSGEAVIQLYWRNLKEPAPKIISSELFTRPKK